MPPAKGVKKATTKPRHWPEGLPYRDSYCYHSSVAPSLRQFIQGNTSSGKGHDQGIGRTQVIVRLISDPSHPACGQYGLFAARKVLPKTHIIDYIGEVHCDDRAESNYDLSLHRFQDGVCIGIDATSMGNEARFINDYRGIKDKPNVVFIDARIPSGELRMGIWSTSDGIRKGEEILVSYGKAWWRARSEELR
ncbi:SET domain protein [Amanita muscaria]